MESVFELVFSDQVQAGSFGEFVKHILYQLAEVKVRRGAHLYVNAIAGWTDVASLPRATNPASRCCEGANSISTCSRGTRSAPTWAGTSMTT